MTYGRDVILRMMGGGKEGSGHSAAPEAGTMNKRRRTEEKAGGCIPPRKAFKIRPEHTTTQSLRLQKPIR